MQMEPIVLFGVVLVVYCGALAALDECRGWKKAKAEKREKRARVRHRPPMRRREARTACRAGGVAGYLPLPARDSA